MKYRINIPFDVYGFNKERSINPSRYDWWYVWIRERSNLYIQSGLDYNRSKDRNCVEALDEEKELYD